MSTPDLIAMFAITSGEPERMAEFRWSAEAGVTLTIFKSEWGRVAQQYYDHGVPDRAEMKVVPRSEGQTFMRVLATLDQGSYCSFIVES